MRLGPYLFVGVFLFLLWIAGFLIFHVAGSLIHIFLIFAVVSLGIHHFWAKPV
ncbi:MAG TPA: DUF5670 family protein [Candidatus Acidoferrales bacterium]|nr:DUF5670 family protein [Candidatus Acidoferrales bacterium]